MSLFTTTARTGPRHRTIPGDQRREVDDWSRYPFLVLDDSSPDRSRDKCLHHAHTWDYRSRQVFTLPDGEFISIPGRTVTLPGLSNYCQHVPLFEVSPVHCKPVFIRPTNSHTRNLNFT